MSIFFKNRRQKLVDIYKGLQNKSSNGYIEVENIINAHPKIELAEAILMSACLEREMKPAEFDEALRKLGVK